MADSKSSRSGGQKASKRKKSVAAREVDVSAREEALRPREEAAQARSDVDALMGQVREANEQLIVANLRSQTLAEDAKHAEDKAREGGERFQFLAESLPTKIFTSTPEGNSDYFNRLWREFTGRSFDQLKGWGWAQCIPSDDVERYMRAWRHALQTGEPFQCQHRLRRADGVDRWHLTSAQAMRDAGGNIVIWFGSSTEIDEQKRAEEHLAQLYKEAESLNRAKDDFLATVSHELRTPMTSILGWAALLAMGNLDETTRREGIATIHRSAKMQAQLIDDVLDVSRMITSKLRLTIEPVDMENVLRVALTAIVPAAEAKELQIGMDFQPGLPQLGGDPARLQQVFWNLLSNAVKFTPAGGRIDVRLFSGNSKMVVEVQDTGVGISAEFLPYAFDRFAQQESGTIRHHGGMGIGLSIVKQLVELHGGAVSVASEGEGRGATFTVSIPVQSTSLKRPVPTNAGQRGEKSTLAERPSIAGLRILLVDDEPDSRRTITAILERYGAIVTATSSAQESFALSQRESFDVLLCDIAMPEEDGYSLIRRIRSSGDERSRIPAVALTAYGRPLEQEIALAEGFNEYMKKPVEPEELIKLVAGAARRKD